MRAAAVRERFFLYGDECAREWTTVGGQAKMAQLGTVKTKTEAHPVRFTVAANVMRRPFITKFPIFSPPVRPLGKNA
jgi:hypothetical protein